ncbi:MAG: type II toxin-antitoxin system Phd/YefM family antitoxin [Acidobacteria bacterium]|nr:type II toxin-antitoxin system Phd/YefM family antitoxin [Acidobacteriota bacterium]
MKTIQISKARAEIFSLVDEAAEEHEPVLIVGKRNNAVLVSEGDWRAQQETLYLLSVPGLREAINEASATPLEACLDEDRLLW